MVYIWYMFFLNSHYAEYLNAYKYTLVICRYKLIWAIKAMASHKLISIYKPVD